MYQTETLDAVRDAAQQLTREGKVLTLGNPEFPLAVFADTYQVDDDPTNTELPEEEIVAVEEYFDELNQDSTPAADDSREAIVNNLFTAISKIQFTTTNVIIPSISAMHSHYAGLQQAVSQAEYSVKPWRYLAPHDSPVLVNHVNTRYVNVRPKESYVSYELAPIKVDSIIELMAVNNPHLEQEEVTEWALQLGAERIEAVWNSLFGLPGPVTPASLPYLSLQAAPFNVDDILIAYFICGHYIDNPESVPGVSVDLEDWQHTMKLLHECFGFYLMRAYLRRMEARESGELILRNEAVNPIETRRAVVIVNGDVFDPWIIGGGDFQAVLGAAIENTGVTNLRNIEADSAKYIARWHAIYPLIKQAAIDYSERQRINNVIATFREVSHSELLKDRRSQEIESKLKQALSYLRRDDYDNPYKIFSTLVCRVYFPEDTYIEYLDSIDAIGQDFPKASVRELHTQATISLVALFLAKQMDAEDFIPVIDATDDSTETDLLAVSDYGNGEETAEVIDATDDDTVTINETVEDDSVDTSVFEEESPEYEVDDVEEEDPYAEFIEEDSDTKDDETESEIEADELKETADESTTDEEASDEDKVEEDETPLA